MESLVLEANEGYKGTLSVCMVPFEQYAWVDPKFVADFHDHVGLQWILTDPHGNNHLVEFNGSLEAPYLTRGWIELLDFYGIQQMHCGLLHLKGWSMFDMVIIDDHYRHIPYPLPLPVVEGIPIDMAPPPVVHDFFPLHPPVPVHSVNRNAPLEAYLMIHTTWISEYRAKSCQLSLPRNVALYLRGWGIEPWILRGPSGFVVPVNLLAPYGELNVKLGSGWRHFCTLHGIVPGDILTLKFTNGMVRIIDVDVLKFGADEDLF